MKRIEVTVKGGNEEEMGREMLSGIYGVLQSYGCTDVSVRADTIAEKGGIQVPGSLKPHGRGIEDGRG